MDEDGHWVAEGDWAQRASVDFSGLRLVTRTLANTEATRGDKEESEPDAPQVKPIVVEAQNIDFQGWIFPGEARFLGTQFHGAALLNQARFHGDARFGSVRFHGVVWFDEAQFSGVADFSGVRFDGGAEFGRAQFRKVAAYNAAQFHGAATFDAVCFHGESRFGEVRFYRDAGFYKAQFHGKAWFSQANFEGNVSFAGARFREGADFRLVTFPMVATFAGAHFEGQANFNAIRGERAFDLEKARFELVPDFIQAHFEEAPRLDNVVVVGRMVVPPLEQPPEDSEDPFTRRDRHRRYWERCRSYPRRWWRVANPRIFNADGNIPALWRALKRLAIQAHDQDREHEFFAGEVSAARFATDRPLPWPIWQGMAWASFARFVLGYFYQWFSNFGRSITRPFLWWIAAIGIGAMAYLGEHRGWIGDIDAAHHESVFAPVRPMVRFYDDWRADRPCFTPPAYQGPGNVAISGLSDQLRGKTSAPNEALHLALRNAFLVLDGGEEAARRIYGCLYGLELYNQGDPVPIVPPGVSTASAVQKIFSAVMIFLFGLALRNMLKMK
jgi:uncharacterized protein YjbI with pentapeptide repeats